MCFILGLFFIFVRWPVVGIILEIYSCVVLFGLVSSSSENSFGSVCIYMLVHCTLHTIIALAIGIFALAIVKKEEEEEEDVLLIHHFLVRHRGFWPSVKAFLYQIPFIGWILQYPIMVSFALLPFRFEDKKK